MSHCRYNYLIYFRLLLNIGNHLRMVCKKELYLLYILYGAVDGVNRSHILILERIRRAMLAIKCCTVKMKSQHFRIFKKIYAARP